MATTTVYDLGIEVVLYLVAFQQRCQEESDISFQDTRNEVLKLFNDLTERSHVESGLYEQWTIARNPLVYLVDEMMILNCQWPHRKEWADNCLEVALLGHATALRGEQFYEECDQAVREMETAERNQRHDYPARVEIVMLFYVCLQTGFRGSLAIDLEKWREYKSRLFSKLPAYAQTRTQKLFPQTTEHTIELDPNYEPRMRLMYVVLAFAFVLVLYFTTTGFLWRTQTSALRDLGQVAAGDLPQTASPPVLPDVEVESAGEVENAETP